MLLRSVYVTTFTSKNYLQLSFSGRMCSALCKPGNHCILRDEPASKKAKKEHGAAGDTTAVSAQQTQSSNAQQGHDSSNAYNYYGQQWGGHYVSVLPLHLLVVVFV